MRCVDVARHEKVDIEPYFRFEMSAFPPSLFNGHFMRSGDKSSLADFLLHKVEDIGSLDPSLNIPKVVDGGCLVQSFRGQKGKHSW